MVYKFAFKEDRWHIFEMKYMHRYFVRLHLKFGFNLIGGLFGLFSQKCSINKWQIFSKPNVTCELGQTTDGYRRFMIVERNTSCAFCFSFFFFLNRMNTQFFFFSKHLWSGKKCLVKCTQIVHRKIGCLAFRMEQSSISTPYKLQKCICLRFMRINFPNTTNNLIKSGNLLARILLALH